MVILGLESSYLSEFPEILKTERNSIDRDRDVLLCLKRRREFRVGWHLYILSLLSIVKSMESRNVSYRVRHHTI